MIIISSWQLAFEETHSVRVILDVSCQRVKCASTIIYHNTAEHDMNIKREYSTMIWKRVRVNNAAYMYHIITKQTSMSDECGWTYFRLKAYQHSQWWCLQFVVQCNTSRYCLFYIAGLTNEVLFWGVRPIRQTYRYGGRTNKEKKDASDDTGPLQNSSVLFLHHPSWM